MATDFDKDVIITSGGLKPSTVDTPSDIRTRINTIEDMELIPLPYIGMLVYVIDEDEFYIVKSLKSKPNGPIELSNAVVDKFEKYYQIPNYDFEINMVDSATDVGVVQEGVYPNITFVFNILANSVESEPEPDPEPENVPCVSIQLDPTNLTFNNLNSSKIIMATVMPTNTTDEIVWTSNDPSIASVENGVVIPKSNGSCVITAICGDCQATCSCTVSVAESTDKVPCTGISISQEIYTVDEVGTKIQLNAELSPSNTTDSISWVSFDKTVAFVNDNGLVTVIGNGETQIYAYCGDQSAYTTVTVNDTSLSDNLVDFILDIEEPNGTTDPDYDGEIIFTNKTKRLATVFAIPGQLTDQGSVTWSCYDTEIAGVGTNNGFSANIYPGRNGTAKLTVSYSNGTDFVRRKIKIIVQLEDNTPDTAILYDNPTITMEGVKAKATYGNAIQYFDVSYKENVGHPSYNSNLELIDEDGYKYYLALTNKGSSPFGKNNLHLDSGGWYSYSSINSGTMYEMNPSALEWTNFDTTIKIKNVNNSLSDVLLNKAIEIFNQTFPAINMVVDESANNTVELTTEVLEDAINAYITMHYSSKYFSVHFNQPEMEKVAGEYSDSNRKWLSTIVHEFGHSLGVGDYAGHLPSMYDYSRDLEACVYLQPNDIAFIEHLHKEMYDIDLTTTQENIQSQAANFEGFDNSSMKDKYFFDYPVYDNIENSSDVIVDCELKFIKNQKINIANDQIVEFDYEIYQIEPINIIKGELKNKQLKIHVDNNLDLDENSKYRLYLKQYDHSPCSLINPYQGIKKI